MAILSRAIPSCGLTSLNLAHNRISLKGAAILSQGIERAINLSELNLDGNLLGQIGARMVLRAAAQAAERAGEFATAAVPSISAISNPVYGYRTDKCGSVVGILSASQGGGTDLTKSTFDPCETAGDYELDLADAYYRSILMKLIKAQQIGRGSFERLRVNGGLTNYNASLELLKNASSWVNVRISDKNSVDELDWTIEVDLPSRSVELPLIEEVEETTFVPLTRSWATDLGVDESRLSCVLRFSYKDLRSRASMGDCLPASIFSKLHNAFCDPTLEADECIELIDTILSTDVLVSVEQMERLLEDLTEDDTDSALRKGALSRVRIYFITKCFHKVAESGRNREFLTVLTNMERRAAENILGQVSLDFTPNNPTGFHRLDLSDRNQREICFRLIELTNEMAPRMKQIKEYYASGRAGGKREDESVDADLERIWRNSTLDGFKFTAYSKVPDRGIVQVDFVQITRPDVRAMQALGPKSFLNEEHFQTFLQKMTEDQLDDEGKVLRVRKHSDSYLFTCQQLHSIMGMLSNSELRAEVLVIGYARTVDWHNYKYALARLTTAERKILENRVGLINLFDELVAVDFYEMDLSVKAQRFVMQELVHLAAIEPGNNMVDVTLNGVDFNVPKTWLKEVARSGVVALYYCREQAVIDKIVEKGPLNGPTSPCYVNEEGTPFGSSAWSAFMPQWLAKHCMKASEGEALACAQPAGDVWVLPYKLRRVKLRMAERFKDARDMFAALDKDGGGSLDRKEMATGLYKLGLWLHPKELQALLDVLDKDGNGTIDYQEFMAFWQNHSFD